MLPVYGNVFVVVMKVRLVVFILAHPHMDLIEQLFDIANTTLYGLHLD
jgi:hypothetical protein